MPTTQYLSTNPRFPPFNLLHCFSRIRNPNLFINQVDLKKKLELNANSTPSICEMISTLKLLRDELKAKTHWNRIPGIPITTAFHHRHSYRRCHIYVPSLIYFTIAGFVAKIYFATIYLLIYCKHLFHFLSSPDLLQFSQVNFR